MGSTSDKMSGKAKQAVGNMTNNKEMQAKGRAQEVSGKMQEKANDVKDDIRRKTRL